MLVRAERARDLPRPPVYVLGNATSVWNRQISSMEDLTITAATESGRRAFEMAGLKPADIDVVELYDAFTINTLLFWKTWDSAPRARRATSSPAAPSRRAAGCRSTPTAAGCAACIPACTAYSS